MNATRHHPVRRDSPQRFTLPVCNCGQDLDFVRGTHCPRCGITLHHSPGLAQAA